MTRLRSRLLVPALALIALVFLFPALAKALPHGEAFLSAAEHPGATPGRLAQIWSLLSALWVENGSILDPDGATGSSSGSGAESDEGSSADNGSILEPNG